MGKKTMKECEKKPIHKLRLKIQKKASKKEQNQQKKNWREIRQEEVEALLQLGVDRNDESVQRLNKEIKEISRQRALARKLVKVPINMSLVPHVCLEETNYFVNKMYASARENVPESVLGLLRGRLLDKFGQSYKRFVWHLWENMWLKVHLRCLVEDSGLVGLSDEAMAEMQPLHLIKLLDGVAVASGERKMKVVVSEFGLGSSYPEVEHIITELVEKMVKAFAKVVPRDARAVFAKAARECATAHAMDLAVRGISLGTQ